MLGLIANEANQSIAAGDSRNLGQPGTLFCIPLLLCLTRVKGIREPYISLAIELTLNGAKSLAGPANGDRLRMAIFFAD